MADGPNGGLGGNLITQPEKTVGFSELMHLKTARVFADTVEGWEAYLAAPVEGIEVEGAETTSQILGRYIQENAVYDTDYGYPTMRYSGVYGVRKEDFLAAIQPGDAETDQAFLVIHKREQIGKKRNEEYFLKIPVKGSTLLPLPSRQGAHAFVRNGDERTYNGLANEGSIHDLSFWFTTFGPEWLMEAKQKIELAKRQGEFGQPENLEQLADTIEAAEYSGLDTLVADYKELMVTQSIVEAVRAYGPFRGEDFHASVEDYEDSHSTDAWVEIKATKQPEDGRGYSYSISLPTDFEEYGRSFIGFTSWAPKGVHRTYLDESPMASAKDWWDPKKISEITAESLRDLAAHIRARQGSLDQPAAA